MPRDAARDRPRPSARLVAGSRHRLRPRPLSRLHCRAAPRPAGAPSRLDRTRPHRRRLADRRRPRDGADAGRPLPLLAPLLVPDGTTGQPVSGDIFRTLGITLLKVIAFFAVMMLVGRRLIPWILHYIAHTGSRELFRLGVLTVALGVAFGAAKLFGVSFALGAFLPA